MLCHASNDIPQFITQCTFFSYLFVLCLLVCVFVCLFVCVCVFVWTTFYLSIVFNRDLHAPVLAATSALLRQCVSKNAKLCHLQDCHPISGGWLLFRLFPVHHSLICILVSPPCLVSHCCRQRMFFETCVSVGVSFSSFFLSFWRDFSYLCIFLVH